ncbi:Os09g0527233 [Oryza sativa Japonica Group]|uniref:Os09g0527233 protein n=1 Tax=Oryza sativa subsp. japonica TaxID=39947 RepID=A0A0P0XQT0_ORYSJ|nr:Os09g0527233 [Oryza sativa Japonica Group]
MNVLSYYHRLHHHHKFVLRRRRWQGHKSTITNEPPIVGTEAACRGISATIVAPSIAKGAITATIAPAATSHLMSYFPHGACATTDTPITGDHRLTAATRGGAAAAAIDQLGRSHQPSTESEVTPPADA